MGIGVEYSFVHCTTISFFYYESFWFRKRKDTNICTAFYSFRNFSHLYYFLILQLFMIQVVVMFCYCYQAFTIKEKIGSRKLGNLLDTADKCQNWPLQNQIFFSFYPSIRSLRYICLALWKTNSGWVINQENIWKPKT